MTTTYHASTPSPYAPNPGPGARRAALVIGLTVLVVLVAAAGWVLTTRVFGRSDFNVTTGAAAGAATTVRIDGDDADLTVGASTDGEFHVHAAGRYSGSEPEVSVRVEGSVAVVTVRCPTSWFSWCDLNATVEVPQTLPVKATTDNGTLEIRGLDSDLDLTSDNGTIDVTGGGLRLNAVTDNGNISVENSPATDVGIQSDNGRIDVELSSVPVRLQAETDNGDVDLTVSGAAKYLVDTNSDNGEIRVEVGIDTDSPNHITASTDNGDITIRPSA